MLALAARKEPASKELELKEMKRDDIENGFCFLGLVGIYDPPRPQSRGAVLECKQVRVLLLAYLGSQLIGIQAGINIIMLTGDRECPSFHLSFDPGSI